MADPGERLELFLRQALGFSQAFQTIPPKAANLCAYSHDRLIIGAQNPNLNRTIFVLIRTDLEYPHDSLRWLRDRLEWVGGWVPQSMTREQLAELGYIVPIATVASILQHGILSHNRAAKLQHHEIALQQVNDYRATVIVPAPNGGRKLHDYANLYICPRNPMMLKRSAMREQLCVLRVSPEVIDIPGAVITDSNAGSRYRMFKPAPDGLSIVNYDRTFADDWRHPENQIEAWRHSAQKCAEVLVPNVVPVRYITGAYVCSETAQASLEAVANGLALAINEHMFFAK